MSETLDRTRTVKWQDPLATAARASEMSGIEFLEAIRAGRVPPPPIAVLMGFSIVDVAEGRATFATVPEEYHYNPIGVVHGGVAAALLDSAMGCAVQSRLPRGRTYTTLDVQVRYLRPLTRGTGRVLCTGTSVHAGGRIATAEGRILDEAGRLYATGTTSCLLLDVPAAARPRARQALA